MGYAENGLHIDLLSIFYNNHYQMISSVEGGHVHNDDDSEH